jgi:inner membrane protein
VDNVCHTLVGAALGEAGLKRGSRFGAAALMISANIPDLDVLIFATNTSPVSFRRGWTHGIVAQIALPVLMTGALWLLDRRTSREQDGTPPFHAGWLLLLSYIGLYSHVFLDYLNNYGVRLLTPFDWRWFYGDAVFIIDPWLWLVLGVGVWLARRRRTPASSTYASRSRDTSRASARFALVIASFYIVAMLVSARVARSIVDRQWTDAHGVRPHALMVGPAPISPMTRDVVVDAGNHYERGSFSWPSKLDLNEHIPKNDDRPEVAAAREDPRIRALLVWSRFPFWTLEPVEGGTRVTVIDARFMARGTFSASTVVPARPASSD